MIGTLCDPVSGSAPIGIARSPEVTTVLSRYFEVGDGQCGSRGRRPERHVSMSSSRRPHVAAVPLQREPDDTPLGQLPTLHTQLVTAVLTRRSADGRAGFGAAIPIRLDVLSLLYSSDHLGRLGIVPGLLAMERVTRLALGDSAPVAGTEQQMVWRACRYLSVQTERLLQLGVWSTAATGEIATLVDEVLSRVDVHSVHHDWEQAGKHAAERIEEIDATVPQDQAHLQTLEAQRAACVEMTEMDYIDYEGQLYDAITARFTGAGTDAFEWYGFVTAETATMVGAAKSLLGLSEHSRRRLAVCPMQCGGQVGLSEDPDLADCDVCAWTSPISDGQADAWFRAFRDGGYQPERVA